MEKQENNGNSATQLSSLASNEVELWFAYESHIRRKGEE